MVSHCSAIQRLRAVGTTQSGKQTALTVQYVYNGFQLSVLAEALAIFRGHVLKLVLQVLADCAS